MQHAHILRPAPRIPQWFAGDFPHLGDVGPSGNCGAVWDGADLGCAAWLPTRC